MGFWLKDFFLNEIDEEICFWEFDVIFLSLLNFEKKYVNFNVLFCIEIRIYLESYIGLS